MFFLPEDKARESLIQLDPAFSGAPLFVDDRCVILFQFRAAHEVFGAQHEALEAADRHPALVQFAYHPWQLLFEMLRRLEQRLETLEKKLKTS